MRNKTHEFKKLSPFAFRLSPAYGFTLIETMVSVAIFLMLALVVYQAVSLIIREARLNRDNTTVSALADQYLEIAKNLPYSQVGTISGNPHGTLPDQPNATTVSFNGGVYQIYYEVTYVDDPADGTIALGTDFAPDDYKQIKLSIVNTTTNVTSNFLSTVVPKGLEGLASGGAISIQVIDSVGQPVSGASIHITNTALAQPIDLTRASDSKGNWIEVGLPDSSNSYHVVVTKNGYSTDQTYPITVGNPNPIKPDATVSNGQVTKISFAIDKVSTLVFNTLDQTCLPIKSVNFEVFGSKLIGLPSLFKFDNTYTSDGNGQSTLSNIEWDNYIPNILGKSYMIYGSSPIQQISLLPNTNQTFTLILGTQTTYSLLVIVKDASTGNAIEGSTVQLQDSIINPLGGTNTTFTTGGSIWAQQNWTGGSGQAGWNNNTRYFSDDGHISTTDSPTGIRLINSGGHAIASSGNLTSSTFDTGTSSSSYTTLTWQPTSQDPATSVSFQIATNNDNATWNFIGPDGTSNTYYTVPGTSISTANNSKRYIRYKVFLSTSDMSKIPVVTSININYVSGCFTPGQVMFSGLNSAKYQITVTKAGYITQNINPYTVDGYKVLEVDMSPSLSQ